MDIIFATNNNHKLNEAKEICSSRNVNIYSLNELEIDIDIIESGKSFYENALIKARTIKEYINKSIKHYHLKDLYILSDDSGLIIDYLNGKPGIYSSRYLGENESYINRMKSILDMMKDVEYQKRTARFACCALLYKNEKDYFFEEQYLEGHISNKIVGNNGFGYDPFFYIDEYKKTAAEIDISEKNKISHRSKALNKLFLKIF